MTTTTQDELDIVRATHTYALGLDRFEPELALSAFAADAVWDATAVGLERYEGHEQIRAFFENDAKAVARQFHILTNHIVAFDDADHARGTNYVFSEGETRTGAKFKAIALNEDTYVRTPQGWRIASRVISPLTTPEMAGFEV
ncbi:nuclear transport factor 2 family protein [Nocardioides houyundeii]|uniref:nuclear transport factor 2 family protein n=1 Tax=Nocardioides houyundeii TaxID=2045452 RepID=UPI000C795452|nr:nuclear transport factor 2 family protein [Nocardioides houyundeii]